MRTAFVPFNGLFTEYLKSDTAHNMKTIHYHASYEIYLLTEGERFLFYNDTCHSCKPGDMFLLRPFDMHYCQSLSSPHYARYVANFCEDDLKDLLTPTESRLLFEKLSSAKVHLNDEQYQQILNCFQGLLAALPQTGFLKTKLQHTYLLQILLIFKDVCTNISADLNKISTNEIKPELLHALNYIHSNYHQAITLDDVTEEIHMSKYYFCRQFRNTTGCTFLEYLNSVRLNKAHELLLNTNLSMSKIAERVGLASNVQFSRLFHSVYGCTPSSFRKQSKKKAEE